MARTAYLVGENGPEIFTPDRTGKIVTGAQANRTMAGSGGAVSVTVNINGGIYGGDPKKVGREVAKLVQPHLSKLPKVS